MADRVYYYYVSTDNRVLRICRTTCEEIYACDRCAISESSADSSDTIMRIYCAITNDKMDELDRKIMERSLIV